MNFSLELIDIFLLLVIIFYVLVCPYTKVEESFNLQATFDILHFGYDLDQYDHLQFPGVVPRTFIGPLIISTFSFPFIFISKLLGVTGIGLQMIVRLVLGMFSFISLTIFRQAINNKFNKRVAQIFTILCTFQFHLCFYSSRTLPNIFAFNLCILSYALWFNNKALSSLFLLAFAAIIFRCDIVILLITTALSMLISGEIKFWKSLFSGLAVSILALIMTVAIDSIFWKRWLWPEGVVLFFNTVENRSSEWGVFPFHWYFTNALPKSLNVVLVFFFIALIGLKYNFEHHKFSRSLILGDYRFKIQPNSQAFYYILPAILFICLYSYLPHKELRFIFPALPMFTFFAAIGVDQILPQDSNILAFPLSELYTDLSAISKKDKPEETKNPRSKSYGLYPHLISLIFVGCLALMLVLANFFLLASNANYPGGIALDRLLTQHIRPELIDNPDVSAQDPYFVYIDTLAATSGISRFIQERILIKENDIENFEGNYLNFSPFQWNQLPENAKSKSKNLVFYSKDENIDNFEAFDWIIGENLRKTNPDKFAIVEQVQSFDRFQLIGYFPYLKLKKSLNIYRRVSK